MDYVDVCPPPVVQRIEATDLTQYPDVGLLSWVADQGDMDCTVSAVAAVAKRMPSFGHLQSIDDFCSAVATYGALLNPQQKALVREAYLRLPYHPEIAFNYFLGLRKTGIDIRDYLRPRVRVDWSFSGPRNNAATWDYYLYLASLGDKDAMTALAEKIAKTENGNEVGLYLASLVEAKLPGTDEILKAYEHDQRRVEGANGPTTTLEDMVKVWLTLLSFKP